MAIHYTCRCGANIRLPSNVAGRKARCNSCGFIFTVPSPELNPEGPRPNAKGKPVASDGAKQEQNQAKPDVSQEDDDEEWYPSSGKRPKTIEFDDESFEATWRTESDEDAGDDEIVSWDGLEHPKESTDADDEGEWYPSSGERPKLIDFADAEPEEEKPKASVYSREAAAGAADFDGPGGGRDEERSGIIEARRPYWAELAGSFLFFLDGGSFVSFIMLVVLNVMVVPLLSLGGYLAMIGAIASAMISGYMCTFYMSVILDTAAGEDELPNIGISNIVDDVILSALRFAGTVLWVLLPAGLFVIADYVYYGIPASKPAMGLGIVSRGLPLPEHAGIALGLVIMGIALWPVVILGVSIGGGFHGVRPITIIRTAAAAPVAYAAMCVVLLIAAGLSAVPYWGAYRNAVFSLASKSNMGLLWTIAIFNSALSIYAMIVAMRAIGLYYRHYKRRFPWVAE